MFNEPTEKEVNLLPLVVHGVKKVEEREKRVRDIGFGTCGQITLSLSGEGWFTDSFGRPHRIRSGDLFFIKPESAHCYEPITRPWIVKYILFSGCEIVSIFDSLNLPSSGVVSAETYDMKDAAELVSVIDTVYCSNAASRHITASAYLYKLLAIIAKSNANSARNLEISINKLAPAVHYIKNHFNDFMLTTELIAEHAGMSHSHLCRLFAATYNMTPHDYIMKTRLENAKLLLSEKKDMTVQQIAAVTGFNSASYFIKVFKIKTGLTPTQFRHKTTYKF